MNIIDEIRNYGIVPVIKIEKVEDALPLAKALCEGGLPVAEVTYRTSCAQEAIRLMCEAYPDMLVGAGTVLTCEQVDGAIAAGAKFIVSPGLNPKVVSYCLEKNVPIIPGTATPSDMERAIELGLKTVKFFPAEANGGIKSIKAMSAPYGNLEFMPTGGVNAANLNDYLSFPKIVACGGTWMIDAAAIKEGNFDRIRELTEIAVDKMLNLKLAHVGINCANESEADEVTTKIHAFSKEEVKAGNSSNFVGGVEVMKTPYLGACGHIAYSTNYINRAVFHLTKRGFHFDENTAKYDEKGNLKAIYAKEEIGGFAFHLVQSKEIK